MKTSLSTPKKINGDKRSQSLMRTMERNKNDPYGGSFANIAVKNFNF